MPIKYLWLLVSLGLQNEFPRCSLRTIHGDLYAAVNHRVLLFPGLVQLRTMWRVKDRMMLRLFTALASSLEQSLWPCSSYMEVGYGLSQG